MMPEKLTLLSTVCTYIFSENEISVHVKNIFLKKSDLLRYYYYMDGITNPQKIPIRLEYSKKKILGCLIYSFSYIYLK